MTPASSPRHGNRFAFGDVPRASTLIARLGLDTADTTPTTRPTARPRRARRREPLLTPIAVYDTHDPHLNADPDARAALNTWARTQGLRPNVAYRWEIYRTTTWWVRAWEYAAEPDGTLLWDTTHDQPQPAPPYDQPLTQTPPGLHVVELPFGLPLISANDRIHHHARAERTRALRTAAAEAAAQASVPRLAAASVIGEYRPGPRSRRRDAANWSPSFKAAADGIVDAGVLPDDDASHMVGPDPRLGPPDPDAVEAGIRWGRIVLYLRPRPDATHT